MQRVRVDEALVVIFAGSLPVVARWSLLTNAPQVASCTSAISCTRILDESGAQLYACELVMNLVPRVKEVITAADFYDLSDGAQIIFT